MTTEYDLQQTAALQDDQLDRIAGLERACTAAEGIRIKLEWGVLRSRPGDRVEDFLCYQQGRLVGFLGLYQYREDEVEICGMVHPEARRRGVFGRLLDAAGPQLKDRGVDRALLVSDRRSAAATGFAAHRGAGYGWSEYLMERAPGPVPDVAGSDAAGAEVTIRQAAAEDAGFVADCIHQGFGAPGGPPAAPKPSAFADPARPVFVIERSGAAVGTVKTRIDGHGGGFVYGLSVLPELRGQGIGGAALPQLVGELRVRGAERLSLEVACANESALRLYQGCGFSTVATTDYHVLDGIAAGAPR